MKINKIIYIFILMLCGLFVGCGNEEKKEEVKEIQEVVYESKEVLFEKDDKVLFEDLTIEIIYTDEEVITETIEVLKYANVYDIINLTSNTGDKEVVLNIKDVYNNDYQVVIKVKVVEKTYKTSLKEEILNYKNDVEYSSEVSVLIKEIKFNTIASINSAVSYEEAKQFIDFGKELIDDLKTLEEEIKEFTVLDLLNKINEIEEKIKGFINYDDSSLKEEIDSIKEVLNSDTSAKDIKDLQLVIESLSSAINSVSGMAEENNQKINAIAEMINSINIDSATKKELEELEKVLKEECTKAIENMSDELLDKIKEIDIIIEDGVLKWRSDKYDDYKVIADLQEEGGSGITSAGLNEEGRLIIYLSNGDMIDAGFVYDASANEKIVNLENIVNETSEKLTSIDESIELLEFMVDDIMLSVSKMTEYFAKMGFNFETGSSLDLMTAIMTLLPEQLKNLGYDFDMSDSEKYISELKKMKADYEMIVKMLDEIKLKTDDIYNIASGNGTLLEKELLMQDVLNDVSDILIAMGTESDKALVIEEFLKSLKNEKQEELISKIKEYFNVIYKDELYVLNSLELGKYYDECLEYSIITKYDSKEKVDIIKEEIYNILNQENVIIDSKVTESLLVLEKSIQEVDTNLEVVKAYFAYKLENSTTLEVEKMSIYKNRILTTNSIMKAIELYELAIK